MKSDSAVQQRTKAFIKRARIPIDFHPHLMRKIMPKIMLDIDPGALEIVRRAGGWASYSMLHKIYAQKQHRVSQEKHNELLEGRHLTAIDNLTTRNRRGGSRRSK